MNRRNTIKKKYESHTLTKNLPINLYKFEVNNIKLLDYFFNIFIVMFGFTFTYENKDLVSNDDLLYVL